MARSRRTGGSVSLPTAARSVVDQSLYPHTVRVLRDLFPVVADHPSEGEKVRRYANPSRGEELSWAVGDSGSRSGWSWSHDGEVETGRQLFDLMIRVRAVREGAPDDENATIAWIGERYQIPLNVAALGTSIVVKQAQCPYPGDDWITPQRLREAAQSQADRSPSAEPTDPVLRAVHRSEAIYVYLDANRRFCFHVLRIRANPIDGTPKYFRKLTYAVNDGLHLDGGTVHQVSPPLKWPLYRVWALVDQPDAPVLVVEGEKTADAAVLLFPDYAVVTWAGGAENVKNADWSPLAGRRAVLLPDLDEPGEAAMNHVASLVRRLPAPVGGRASQVTVARVPRDLRLRYPKHDCADPDPPDYPDWARLAVASAMAPDADILDLNRRYSFVENVGKEGGLIYDHEQRDKDRRWISVVGFERVLLNRDKRQAITTTGRVVEQSLAQAWLESPDRRTHTGIEFDPAHPYVAHGGGPLNLFTGWETKPEAGDWGLIHRMLWHGLAAQKQDRYDYLIRYWAHLFQRPAELPKVAVMVRSTTEGIGKSLFGEIIERMIGTTFASSVTGDEDGEFSSGFNSYLDNTIFLRVEELARETARKQRSLLQALITNNEHRINVKGVSAYNQRNFLRLYMTSNEDIPLSTSGTARRYFTLTMEPWVEPGEAGASEMRRVADVLVRDRRNGAQAPQLRAFMHHLLREVDISEFNPMAFPSTPDTQAQRNRAVIDDPISLVLYDAIVTGYLGKQPFPEYASHELLYAAYRQHATQRHHRSYLSRQQFLQLFTGRFFRSDWDEEVPSRAQRSTHLLRYTDACKQFIAMHAESAEPTRYQTRCFRLGSREEARQRFMRGTRYLIPEEDLDESAPLLTQGDLVAEPPANHPVNDEPPF